MTDNLNPSISQLLAKHGVLPPPWIRFPEVHPYDIGWRMGAGESYLNTYYDWWQQEKYDFNKQQRIEMFRKWPPPHCWLTWMIDIIWDIDLSDVDDPESFDYSDYFKQTEMLGFGTQADFQRDIDHPKWFKANF